MSISASWIVLAVLLLRALLKKAPKWMMVLLWGIVAIRLVCPFTIESVMSLMPSPQVVSPTISTDTVPRVHTGISVLNHVINPMLETSAHAPEASVNPMQMWIFAFAVIWVAGMFGMLIYNIISYWRIKRQVKTAVWVRDNIYQTECVGSPFVLGTWEPKIYLPFHMNEQAMEHVIAHEQAHIRRKDHWWKPIGFLILTLHWFNPLMWFSYTLLCRDIELACDEKVIKELDNGQKADYSQALLDCSVNRRMITVCPLAFGEVSVKDRVKQVLHYKEPAFWIIAVGTVACIIVAVCFLTNPKVNYETSLTPEMSAFVEQQIIEHNQSGREDAEFACADFKVFGAKKDHEITTVYTRVFYMEYAAKKGELEELSGARMDVAITIKNVDGELSLVEYWKTPDGSGGREAKQKKFPREILKRMDEYPRYPNKEYENCKKKAEVYFSSQGIDISGKNTIKTFETTVSYANWAEESEIYTRALNTDKMSHSNIRHLPIYKFDTLQDLEQFKQDFGDTFTMDRGYDEVPSFQDATAKYDSAFFDENSLLLVYVSANNSTHRFNMHSVGYDAYHFYVHIVETTNAEIVDDAMAGWFVTVAVKDTLMENGLKFDADLNNAIEYVDKDVKFIEHYKNDDGMWVCGDYTYRYRLELSGRMPNAVNDSTFVVLSNVSDITFDWVWRAAGFSSNMASYFDPKDAVVVGWK